MKLTDVPAGKHFTIESVAVTQPDIRKRLIDMGFVRGVEGVIMRSAPLGDPIEMHIMGYDLSLRREEADGILVDTHCRRCGGNGHGRRRRMHGGAGGRGRRGRS